MTFDKNKIPLLGSRVFPGEQFDWDDGVFNFWATIYRDDTFTIDSDDSHNTEQSVTGCTEHQQHKLLEARAAWERDEWFYCTLSLDVFVDGFCMTDDWRFQLRGVACNYPDMNNIYITEAAGELVDQFAANVKEIVRRKSAWADEEINQLLDFRVKLLAAGDQ